MRQVLSVGLLAAFLLGDVASAEIVTRFGDFSAKRVRAPAAGSTAPRITIQIDPEEQARLLQPRAKPEIVTVTPETGGPETPLGRYTRFWDFISPDIDAAGPGRLEPVLMQVAEAGVPAPRLQTLQDMARAHGAHILRATVGTQVSPALVLAVMSAESAGDVHAVSSAGAEGLMQLMPDTAARFGVTDSKEPGQNIAGGVKYLDWLMTEFGRDPVLVLAGYNAGEGAVRTHKGVPPYAETRDYVPKVLAAFRVARGLCLTPPQLISDGCVFAGLN